VVRRVEASLHRARSHIPQHNHERLPEAPRHPRAGKLLAAKPAEGRIAPQGVFDVFGAVNVVRVASERDGLTPGYRLPSLRDGGIAPATVRRFHSTENGEEPPLSVAPISPAAPLPIVK
jgi:hypothetical protein